VRELTFDNPFLIIAVAVVGVAGVTRWTHLIVDDDYPPVQWLTFQYAKRVPEKWVKLVECPWCVSPYIGAWVATWLLASQWEWLPDWLQGFAWNSWWFANSIAAASQVAAMVHLRDVPPEMRE
jgi:hypothetical protein